RRRCVSQNRIHIVFAGVLLDGAHTHLVIEDEDIRVRVTRRLISIDESPLELEMKPHEEYARHAQDHSTQPIINTFHYAGVFSKNVALDAPRLKEIINVATNIENMFAKSSLTHCFKLWYDLDPTSTIIKDSIVIEFFFALPDEEMESKIHLKSPWLLQLAFDHARRVNWYAKLDEEYSMLDHSLTPHYRYAKLDEEYARLVQDHRMQSLMKNMPALYGSTYAKPDCSFPLAQTAFSPHVAVVHFPSRRQPNSPLQYAKPGRSFSLTQTA
ncbi:hypothetical protein BKA82DRAFT_32169, partial [Pisolithus tinctorius]